MRFAVRIRPVLVVPVVSAALVLAGVGLRSQTLPQDQGAAGTYQKMLKLKTTASLLHTTAHPDDERGGMLAVVSRGTGARTALLCSTRGEGGDNAIGPELFDGLGLIRTEELIVSGRYYGLDDLYFSTVADYGFSKRLDEALDKWGKDNILGDIVRVIRINRPFVVVSVFRGNQRDGHGNHQTMGLMTQEAAKIAGDPKAFPEQIAAGLRPWQPLKVYIPAEEENYTIKLNTGEFSPWIGDSYATFAAYGLSFQRCQNSGRFRPVPGPAYVTQARVQSVVPAPDKETSYFDGIDVTISGMFNALRKAAPEGAVPALQGIELEVDSAFRDFRMNEPWSVVPALARGLAATRRAIEKVSLEPDAVFLLRVKEQQFMDAINTALGIDFVANAQPGGTPEPTGTQAMFAAPVVMGPLVPGQKFEIRTSFTNRGKIEITPSDIIIETPRDWVVEKPQLNLAPMPYNTVVGHKFTITVAADAQPTRPYFSRKSIADARYSLADQTQFGRPATKPPVVAVARYTVQGVPVEVRQVAQRREANYPYGYEIREIQVVPAIAVNLSPSSAILPVKMAKKTLDLQVELINNVEGDMTGELTLKLPTGWTAKPASHRFSFKRSGERSVFGFTVSVPTLESKGYPIEAVATVGGKQYTEGYEVIEHRDLETRYLYHPEVSNVRGIDVNIAPNLRVGYVMGIGDRVPEGLRQLGAKVQLLESRDLARADLSQFDVIMTGTRAYAVREDLRTYNQRLLDWVNAGGNMIVLYNTSELNPNMFAPYPAELGRMEEISEEDAPVEILDPAAPLFNTPNRITVDDFGGWIEQRGSKFWSSWDKAYASMVSSHDKNQEPQKGGWLYAKYGKGHYTYCAYAFHRQLPFGVAGAYRLMANLLSLGKARPSVTKVSGGVPPKATAR